MSARFTAAEPMPDYPQRIQRKRTRGWRMPEGAVYVGRGTIFGNPFPVRTFGRKQAIALHRIWLETATAEDLGYPPKEARRLNALRADVIAALPSLRGKHLACWCRVPDPYERDCCHADVLIELANA